MHTDRTRDRSAWRGRPLRTAAVGLSSAAVVGLLVGMTNVQADDPRPATSTASEGAVWQGYADLVEQVMPSVVAVRVERDASNRFVAGPEGFGGQAPDSEMFERFMERFFGERGGEPFFDMPQMPRGPQMPPVAMGSGFIVDQNGLIVTNNHVVDGAETVTVKLHDGTELEAKVLGTDPDTDLALIKVDTDRELQAVSFADSDEVRVGDPVVAIGSPFGLGGTVTAGIVSADHRAIGAGRYDDFLQIDAPINRGNSGGPAFNNEGKVIGVNTAIQSPTGGNVGIGFAIPANLVVDIVEDLEDDGQVERGWLGVHIQGLDEDLAQTLGLEDAEGALVARIVPDTPAAQAGLQQGDVIVGYNGEEIAAVRDLTRAVADTDPGTAAEITVWRDGEEQTLSVDIARMPADDEQVAALEEEGAEDESTPQLGVALAELDEQTREQLGVSDGTNGVVVTEVQPGSPAAEKGLRAGDVIVEVGQQQVESPAKVAEAVRAAAQSGKKSVLLLIERNGQSRFVAVPLESA